MFRCGFLHLEVQGFRGLGVKGLGCRVFFCLLFFRICAGCLYAFVRFGTRF